LHACIAAQVCCSCCAQDYCCNSAQGEFACPDPLAIYCTARCSIRKWSRYWTSGWGVCTVSHGNSGQTVVRIKSSRDHVRSLCISAQPIHHSTPPRISTWTSGVLLKPLKPYRTSAVHMSGSPSWHDIHLSVVPCQGSSD
jgi:hypothetical protein